MTHAPALLRACMAWTTLAFTALTVGLSPQAQADTINSDRPDVANSPWTVPRGWYQFEQGIQGETGQGGSSLYFPSTHRFGIFPNVEMRVETPIVNVTPQVGFAGLSVGGKWHILDGGGWGEVPALGLQAEANIGADGKVFPNVIVLLDTMLPLGIGAQLNAGPGWDASGMAWDYAASFSHDITNTVSCFAEFSGSHPIDGSTPALLVDGGFLWLLNDDLQLDIDLYRGLTSEAADWTLTTGVSARWGPETPTGSDAVAVARPLSSVLRLSAR